VEEKIMFEQFMIAIEGTKQDLPGVPVALAVADQLGVRATVLSVVERSAQVDAHRQTLESELADLGVPGLAVDVHSSADAAEFIVDVLRQHPGVLACLGTHARSPIKELVLGSVAEQVVRETHAPLLLLGPALSPDWSGRIETILLCVDTTTLSERIVPVVAELARRTRAEIRLVEMLDSIRASVTRASDVAGESSYLHQVADRLKRDFDLSPSWEVLHGKDSASAVTDYARGLPGVVIAMTSHGRSGIEQVLSGSVSHKVLRAANCPVLIVSPEDASG